MTALIDQDTFDSMTSWISHRSSLLIKGLNIGVHVIEEMFVE